MPRDHLFLSVVIVNWNGEGLIQRCLNALSEQTYTHFETIVVDNASSDGSVETIEAQYPGIRLLRQDRNLGFARGNNIGAKAAKGEWLVLLNNDAFPRQNWLDAIVQAINQNPNFSFFSSYLIAADGSDTVDGTGQIVHISGVSWHRDHGLRASRLSRGDGEVFSACAGAAAYERQLFIGVGGFDEDLENYYEDVDLGFRLRLLGYRCLFVANAVVEHIGSASFGQESYRSVYYQQRNLSWTFVKNMPGPYCWIYLPVHLLLSVLFFLRYLGQKKGSAFLRAKWDFLTALPQILKNRRMVQQTRKADPREIVMQMDRNLWSPLLLGRLGKTMKR